jgi:hypothetical protein
MNRSRLLLRVIHTLHLYTITALILGLITFVLRQALLLLSRSYDALDVIPRLWLYCTPTNPETYKESEWQPELSAPEFFALIMVSRNKPNVVYAKRRHTATASSIKIIAHLIHVLYVVQQRRLAMLMHLKSTTETVPSLRFVASRIRLGFLARELHLRNAHFEDKEIEMLRALFSGTVHEELMARLGFGLEDALLVRHAFLARMIPPQYESYLNNVAVVGDRESAVNLMLHLRAMESMLNDRERMTAIAKPARDSSLSLDELHATTGICKDSLNEMLSRMSIDLDSDEGSLADDFLSGDNPTITRPFIRTVTDYGQTRWVLVQPAWVIHGIRRVFETALYKPQNHMYLTHRSKYLENKALELLCKALRPETALANVSYSLSSSSNETVYEADGVIIVGNVAVVVEAKSNRLRPNAHNILGPPELLWQALEPLVKMAIEQGERLRPLILNSSHLRIHRAIDVNRLTQENLTKKNFLLDVSSVTKVYVVAVTLEDLNHIVTVAEDLSESLLSPRGAPAPLLLNIHDLEVLQEIIERPSEFIHYLKQRQNSASNILARDELDYLMHYVSWGLSGDEDHKELTPGLADDLLDWYSHKRGERRTVANKPRRIKEPVVNLLLDALESHRPTGWLKVSDAILSLDKESRRIIDAVPRELKKLTQDCHEDRSRYLEFTENRRVSLGVFFFSLPTHSEYLDFEDFIHVLLRLRQYASKLGAVAAVVSFEESAKLFDVCIFDASGWEPDEEADKAVEEALRNNFPGFGSL